jgi:phosphatidylglycerophosphatase A
VRDRLAVAVATGLGAGYAPVAPGTAGSALGAAVLRLVPFSRAGLLAYFAAVTLAGLWASHRAERLLGGKDPGRIVIDEVAGMTLTVLFLPLTARVVGAGFVLFRILDIVKPFPARGSQRLSGGPGVMVDDLIAGAYGLGALALLRALVRWP